MADEPRIETEVVKKTRRDFVKTSAQVAVTAPAVAMLLNATTKPAQAQTVNYNEALASHILDDYTYGNDREDNDEKVNGSNESNIHPGANLDDHT
jgi:hypothetical protein